MTRKILTFLTILLELAFFSGAYIVHYFTVKTMGMARHVLYLNGKWEKAYPVQAIIVGSIVVIGALALFNVLFHRKRQPRAGKYARLALLVTLCLSAAYIAFGLLLNTRALRAYYLVLILLFGGVLVQNLLTLAVAVSGSRSPEHRG